MRQAKPGKGGRDVLNASWKPFVGTLWVASPTRQDLARHRKRVLRRLGATRRTKRRQPAPKPCYRAPKVPTRGEPSPLPRRGPRPTHRYGEGCRVPPGSKNAAKVQGVPQGPGRPGRLHPFSGVGLPDPKAPGPPAGVGPGGRDEHRRSGWYCQAKATKRGGRGGRESEGLVVPLRPGNPPHGDPAEGRGRRVTEPLEGNTAGASNPGTVCT